MEDRFIERWSSSMLVFGCRYFRFYQQIEELYSAKKSLWYYMTLMHKHIKNFILHYSDVHDKEVSKMVCSQIVPSETDAKRLLSFIDVLFKYSTQDMEEGKIILGELADNYDAEKATLAILALLRENNFNSLVDNWS